MDQVALHTFDGLRSRGTKWPLAIFSPQFSLIEQEEGPPKVRDATPAVMHRLCRRCRQPQQLAYAAGEVGGGLLTAGALTAEGEMQFQTGVVQFRIIGRRRPLRSVHDGLMMGGRRS